MSSVPGLSLGRKALLVAIGFLVTLAVAALFLSLAPSVGDEPLPAPTQPPALPSPTSAAATVPAETAPPKQATAAPTASAAPMAAPPTSAPMPTATPPQLAPHPTPTAPAPGAAAPVVVRALVLEFDTKAYATRFLRHARSTAEPGVVLLMEPTPTGGWGVWVEGTGEDRVRAQLEGLRAELGLSEPPAARQPDQEIEP